MAMPLAPRAVPLTCAAIAASRGEHQSAAGLRQPEGERSRERHPADGQHRGG